MFLALRFVHDHWVANYGVAIILLTLGLRILLFPLNQFSMVKMRKVAGEMQRVQPKLKAIQAKYKKSKDPEARAKMNTETMDLYKREGVNPFGGVSGCLPLLMTRTRTIFAEALKRVDIALPAYDDEAVLWGDPSPEVTIERLEAFGVGEIVGEEWAEQRAGGDRGRATPCRCRKSWCRSIRPPPAMVSMPGISPRAFPDAGRSRQRAPRTGSPAK